MKMRSVDATPGAISARYIKANTERSYRQYIDSLNLFFKDTKLENIHWFNMKEYQEARVIGAPPFIRRRRPHEEPGPCPAKATKANQELRFLARIKKRANSWSIEDEEYYEELQEDENEIPRALTELEQKHWLDISRLKEKWMVVHWYSLLAFDTTMSTNEARGLRIADINLHQQTVSVPWPASKNKYRHRTIAIENADALWACERLLARAHDMGSQDATHYLFPLRDKKTNIYLPTRPMTVYGIQAVWNEVRVAAGMKGFRPYDTRHTGITRYAEDGYPIEIIKAKAGHFSERMSRHYTQISLAAQRKWARGTTSQYRGYSPPNDSGLQRRPPTPWPSDTVLSLKGVPVKSA
jgi:integrase